MRITQSWRVGEYLFTQHRDHGLKDYEGRSLYGFKIDGKESQGNELYASLDEAIAEAIGQKHTGPRGARGSGVDTAAGWFLKMIGAPTTE